MSKTVLVVDDDSMARKSLSAVLEDAGVEVIQAVNGKEGLNTALKEQPDLIVADVHMPEMDGLEMIQHLRDDPWGRGVPVIILTADDAATSINTALSAGVTVYLSKSSADPQSIAEQAVIALG